MADDSPAVALLREIYAAWANPPGRGPFGKRFAVQMAEIGPRVGELLKEIDDE